MMLPPEEDAPMEEVVADGEAGMSASENPETLPPDPKLAATSTASGTGLPLDPPPAADDFESSKAATPDPAVAATTIESALHLDPQGVATTNDSALPLDPQVVATAATPSEAPGSATISNTATDVRQIRMGLEDLQAEMALSFPMTEEEKVACRLPWTGFKLESPTTRPLPEQASTSSALSLANACAVLRASAKRSPIQGQASLPSSMEPGAEKLPSLNLASLHQTDVEFSNAMASLPADPRLLNVDGRLPVLRTATDFSDALRTLAPVLPFEGDALKSRPGAGCGVELRKATQVLKLRLQGGIGSR